MTVPANLVGPLLASNRRLTVGRGSGFTSAGNSTVYSYSATYGLPESPTRYILVGYSMAEAAAASCTVGGITAVNLGSFGSCGFFLAHVPTGTSGSVVLQISSTATGGGIFVWACDGLNTTTGDFSGASGSTTSVTSLGSPAAYFGAYMSADGSGYGVSGTSVVNPDSSTSSVGAVLGPFQQSTIYFNAVADFLPKAYGGNATFNASRPIDQIAALALW